MEATANSSPSAHPKGTLIVLEGNIGVGKTTLGSELAKSLGYKIVLEPTASNPYMELFYSDPKKYALKLQVWIYRQRYLAFVEAARHVAETGQGVILDRSVYSDKVFADVNLDDENITEEGYKYYRELRDATLVTVPVPHVCIFLDAAPAACNSRIASRNRGCESGIPVEYLAKLDAAYRTFLKDMASVGTSVHTLDWSKFGSTADVEAKVRAAIACTSSTETEVTPIPTWAADTAERLRKLDARALVDTLVAKATPEGRIDTFAEEDASAATESALHRRESEGLSEDSPPEKRKVGAVVPRNSAGSPEQISETPGATDGTSNDEHCRNLFGEDDELTAPAVPAI